VRDPALLLEILDLDASLLGPANAAARQFPVLVPRGFIARMQRGNPRDPLLLQVLPLGEEGSLEARGLLDPVGDGAATAAPGLIRKYRGRALFTVSPLCAVHCRYCFRRHFPYEEVPRGLEAWEPALRFLAAHEEITEVVWSGGDPLVLSDGTLAALAARLEEIPHLRRLRLHSRLPIVIPERVDEDLSGWLRRSRLSPVVVVHANHPTEIAGDCAEALRRLAATGVLVLNQSVLLRGINDDARTLGTLSERLLECRVLPYYLHQMDPVEGAGHFRVSEARGREIVSELRRELPGYAVPRYVKEVAGAESKVPIDG
jgi:EF-P beta-lysylation protein EpmB